MAAPNNVAVLTDMSGGVNETDVPLAMAVNQCQSAVNIEWVLTKFGRRRHGSSIVVAGFDAVDTFFHSPIGSMCRHVPGTSEAQAEVWCVDSTFFLRKKATYEWAQVVPEDPMTGNAWDVTWATVDGCLFVAYQSAVNRLHVFDGTRFRRTGLGVRDDVIAPIVDEGVGTYAPVKRWYRSRWVNDVNHIFSEPTGAVAFTPSGTGESVRIQRPAPPFEGETSWTIEASLDGVSFYQIAHLPLTTIFYYDNNDPNVYDDESIFPAVSPLTGTYQLQKSYRFIAGADNRLLGFGTFEVGVGVKQNRVEISDVVGGFTLNPDGTPLGRPAEIINTTGGWYIDLDESDSGPATGLKGPCLGNYYAFKARQMWELRPTGDSTRPFAATAISKTIGAVAHQSIIVGEDEIGRGTLYFWSFAGPYRYTVNGLEYLGHNIERRLAGVNLEATIRVAHGLYHPASKQVWWWVAFEPYDEPSQLLIYHTDTGGWSDFTGINAARCSAMLPNVQGPVMSRELKPHLAPWFVVTPGAQLVKADDDAAVRDFGAQDFSARLTTRPILPGGPGQWGNVGDAQVLAKGTGATLQLETYPNLTEYPPTGKAVTASLTPTSAEEAGPYVFRRFDDSGLGEVLTVHYKLRDLTQVPWEAQQLVLPVRPQGPVLT